ncbi:MAG: hypothetical protein DI539_28040 [Flavobacterium psychrophilum]|nr:MAG: hypothetical protein DI539_28040 [Flavobacterium psychrophilum]
MKLPNVLQSLVKAQNDLDSKAYVKCFTAAAVVHDEGKTHAGAAEIRQWIEQANSEYQSFMKPLNYEEIESKGILTAEVSGTFPGSPAVLQFHVVLEGDLITYLKVTG